MALFVFYGGFMEQNEIVKTAELIKKAINNSL